MNFVIASNNQKKVQELERILKPLGISVKTAAELGVSLDDVEETGMTFKENAEIKAEAALKKTGLPAIADDSGLMVDALGGRPGVYSARYADTDTDKIISTEKRYTKAHISAGIPFFLLLLTF